MTASENTEIRGTILWVDDEVEMLRPHILFLESKGYAVATVTNGEDAVSWVEAAPVDLVLLDESMPGMGGLETLARIKDIRPTLPVVMVTKNEEEALMEEAIGEKISDYLTKPVNPSQILLVVKKFLEGKKIIGSKTAQDYIQEFNAVSQALLGPLRLEEWIAIYRRMVEREVELDEHPELGLQETVANQHRECNQEFCRFFEHSYRDWLEDRSIVLPPRFAEHHLIPHLNAPGPVFFFVIDCMRYDQWLAMETFLQEYYTIHKDFTLGIVPSATPYARNAIFSGLFPDQLERVLPGIWSSTDDDDYSMNKHEKELLEGLLQRQRVPLRTDLKYFKIIDPEYGKQLAGNISSFAKNHLTAVVVNFVDMLAHSRSDTPILKEIAPNEAAYRSLTKSWFAHSSLLAMFRNIARFPDATVIVTTDHGSIRCLRGSKVIGDRETSTNLRYKFGRNVKADEKHAMEIRRPEEYRLPRRGVTVNYVIAKEDYYFVYPTDYNKYLAHYRDSFQHGGISMEEIILPVMTMRPH
ncbi:MAG: response regulator [Bacteroidota bacterium]|nr:response regulator [Bacteroidota bacterium]